MKLAISDDLSLPIEAVTQTFAVLAKRGVGKTYTASVMAEEMLKAGQSLVAIDPTGAWWGLRSEFPVVVLGGEHADVPLEEHAGEVIARAIVENRFPAVLDLGLFRKGQMIRFMTAFAETLYRINREPLHLFVDESDAFAPQGRSGFGVEENRMLGAMEDIVRRGRKRGLGCTLITQRPAVLNKNVLTQCEVLVAMRLLHPKDIGAVMEWVNVQADPSQASVMKEALPSLTIGEAWFWSPGWLEVFKRVRIRKRESFDSSATPKPGEREHRPKHLKEIDLDSLGEQIKATVEKAKADDPKELRRQLAELKRQLEQRPKATERVEVEKIVEVPVLKNGQLEKALKIGDKLQATAEQLADITSALRHEISRASAVKVPVQVAARPRPTAKPAVTVGQAPAVVATDTEVGQGGLRRILTALAQRNGLSARQVGVRAGLSSSSGTFGTYLSTARKAGWVVGTGQRLDITEAGIQALGSYDPLPAGRDLLAYWLRELGDSGAARILQTLADAYPQAIGKDELGERSGLSANSGTFGTYLSKLRTLELIEGRGELRASAELFE